MENPKIKFEIYQGKKNLHEMISIFEENLNNKVSKNLKDEGVLYYGKKNLDKLENVCIDLSKVKDIDSSGISIILRLKQLGLAFNRKNFSIINNEDYVLRMLYKAEINHYVKILKSRDEL